MREFERRAIALRLGRCGKEKPRRSGAFVARFFDYAPLRLRRRNRPNPARAVPRTASEAGSGTGGAGSRTTLSSATSVSPQSTSVRSVQELPKVPVTHESTYGADKVIVTVLQFARWPVKVSLAGPQQKERRSIEVRSNRPPLAKVNLSGAP